jgi:hypothetical protein
MVASGERRHLLTFDPAGKPIKAQPDVSVFSRIKCGAVSKCSIQAGYVFGAH